MHAPRRFVVLDRPLDLGLPEITTRETRAGYQRRGTWIPGVGPVAWHELSLQVVANDLAPSSSSFVTNSYQPRSDFNGWEFFGDRPATTEFFQIPAA